MSDRVIMVISGTNRPDSNALKISRLILGHYQAANVKVELFSLSELPQEIFDPSSYATKPPAMQAIQQRVLGAKGLHVITPEYNGSFPGVLKYFIDMLKFPESFEERPVCFVGLGAGMWGALRPVEQLQAIFGYRNAFVYPVRVFMPRVNSLLDDDGRITDTDVVERLREQAIGFIDFVEHLKGVNLRKEANEQSD